MLDDIQQREVTAIISVGCNRATAARYVGCSVDTIRRTAENHEPFAAALRRAETSTELTHLRHIFEAGKEPRYWRAAAWVLERKFPDRYARRKPGTVSTEQFNEMVRFITETLMDEVAEPETRQRILARLTGLSSQYDAWSHAEKVSR